MENKELIKGEFDYPLNMKYRLFNPITLYDKGQEIKGYGPYGDYRTRNRGLIDINSWKQVIKLWTPDTRIFARLPVCEEDSFRVVEGNKPYIHVTEYSIEKNEKPFGYGQTDYWFFYKFNNIGKQEAIKIITKYAEAGCAAKKFPVGLELKVSDQEFEKFEREKRMEIKKKVFSILKVKGGNQ